MGKSSPSPPPAPDPVATAQAQGAINTQTARTQTALNRVNQVTPYGNLTYSQSGPSRTEWIAQDRENAIRQGKTLYGAEADAQAAGNANYWAPDSAGNFYDKQGYGDQGWTATTTLSPEQQNLMNLSNQAQSIYGQAAVSQLGQAQQALSTPFQYSGPAMQTDVRDRSGEVQRSVMQAERPDYTGIGDPNQSRDAVEQALLSRINPQLEQDRASLEARLANQGITMGSQAWQSGMTDFSQQANDARYGAILNAGQEQSRMVGLGLQQAGFGNDARMNAGNFANTATGQASGMDFGRAQFINAARQQSLQEQLALRAQPINEAAALLSGQQIQMPQFTQVPQTAIQAPDYQGAVGQQYAGQMQGWGQQVQQTGANNAAAGSAVASAATAAALIF